MPVLSMDQSDRMMADRIVEVNDPQLGSSQPLANI